MANPYYVNRDTDEWVYVTKDKDGNWRTSRFKGYKLVKSKAYSSKGEAMAVAANIKQRLGGQSKKPARKAPARRQAKPDLLKELFG